MTSGFPAVLWREADTWLPIALSGIALVFAALSWRAAVHSARAADTSAAAANESNRLARAYRSANWVVGQNPPENVGTHDVTYLWVRNIGEGVARNVSVRVENDPDGILSEPAHESGPVVTGGYVGFVVFLPPLQIGRLYDRARVKIEWDAQSSERQEQVVEIKASMDIRVPD
jgi:hypothetical protein